ncbi:MAG: tRNA pseudouridine(38-40) synthase TruA [Desulfobacterales bacterium]|jgi:tRNA pseudouridine38-40 synthase|nr:tRNA pseudouridine(38-40) synthase TruA [Desulfobacterales bacterium]
MQNFKLTIEYDGTAYHGWQRQADAPTVQAELERALGYLTRSPVTLIGAGRTDAGVHALGQVANFRCETRLEPAEILKGLNSLLPRDIAVRGCCRMPEDFHARFSAKSKRYHYRILNRTTRPAVGRNYAWFIHRPLDAGAMGQAAERLIGLQDFKSFESTGSPRAHTRRHVMQAVWVETPADCCLTFQIEADGFLRGMVRNMVGTLVAVGLGKLDPQAIETILASRDRCRAGITAPARGLFLVEVQY